jgi:preprotein translocase subunit YajC
VTNHFAQPSPAPGRDAPAAPAAPASTTAQDGAPPAKDSGGGASSIFGGPTLLIFLVPFVLMLFLSRNNNKKQKQIEESLKVGDKVVTQSGLLGRITDLDTRLAKIEIAPGVKVEVLKSTVQGKYVPTEDKTKDGKDSKESNGKDEKGAKDDKGVKEDKLQEKKA